MGRRPGLALALGLLLNAGLQDEATASAAGRVTYVAALCDNCDNTRYFSFANGQLSISTYRRSNGHQQGQVITVPATGGHKCVSFPYEYEDVSYKATFCADVTKLSASHYRISITQRQLIVDEAQGTPGPGIGSAERFVDTVDLSLRTHGCEVSGSKNFKFCKKVN